MRPSMSSTLREVSLCAPPSFVFIYDMAIDPLPKDAAAAANSLQSCPTPCDPTDGSPPGSPHPWDSPGKNTGVDRQA